jgi:hypothetical protein
MPAVWHPITADNGAVTVDNILLFASRGAPSREVADGLKKQLTDFGKANPKGAGYIHIIDIVPGRGTAGGEAREAFVGLIKHVTPEVRAALVAIHGSGFAAATARVTASAVVLAAKSAQPIKIHASLSEGIPWFEGAMRKAGAPLPPPGTLLDAGTELLRRIEQRAK